MYTYVLKYSGHIHTNQRRRKRERESVRERACYDQTAIISRQPWVAITVLTAIS
jgi:hypothetical protein